MKVFFSHKQLLHNPPKEYFAGEEEPYLEVPERAQRVLDYLLRDVSFKVIERKSEFKPTLVKRGATIGANATIVCGVVIGEFAFIGAGALVREDVPDFALMVGVPARRIGWMCQCGRRLNFQDEPTTQCPACGALYTTVDKDHIKMLAPPSTQGSHIF